MSIMGNPCTRSDCASYRARAIEAEKAQHYGYQGCVDHLNLLEKYKTALQKIADPRLRHKEPDAYTELG